MIEEKSDNKVSKKWKAYITGIMNSNFKSFNKIDKYFRYPISESTSKAIHENWIRILGIDYEIISMNLCKENKPLGIALEGRNEISREDQEVIQRHYLRAILPHFCIGNTRKFMIKDELLEVNGLKVMGLPTKDVLHALKKLTNYFQIVVARSQHHNYDLASDYGGSEDNINSPISFYDMDEDESSRNGTLRSVTSNYSTTSRDFGSSMSFGGMTEGQCENVKEYLRNMIGWRGPIIIEFRKQKERLGMALDEIPDPKSSQLIIVFKIIVPAMKAGKDGRLHAGDRLLQVNGKSVTGVPFRQVCTWIKSSPGGRLVLCICKPHFESMSFDHTNSANDDKFFYNTLRDADKLPKLSEEVDGESFEIPPVPEDVENHITIKRTESKLGIILDVCDGGKNGVRIKKMTRGIAKEDGRLSEGDFITQINRISLKVDDKNKLNYCLKQIGSDTQDYNISYITAKNITLHNNKFATISSQRKHPVQPNMSVPNIYPDPASIKLNETSNECPSDKIETPKLSFETFDITMENDHQSKLGLMLGPSLKEPERFVSITDIHENSLSDKSGLLKINDEILMVNNVSFENKSVNEIAQFLKLALKSESILLFQVRRLISSDDQIIDPTADKLTKLPDLYYCSIKKGTNGYGFSLLELTYNNGVLVDSIDSNSSANEAGCLKSGDRFVMINKCIVISCSKIGVMQIVKNSTTNLELIMECPKYREFLVKISKDCSMSLGLNVGGGCDTKAPIPIIESLVPNRTSIFSEELRPGDYITEVNGKQMNQLSHSNVIDILRSTGPESTFKILRKIPYLKREIFTHIEIPDFPQSYLQECQYSVQISKPVDSIKSYGITFTDIVIVEKNNDFKVLNRYKAVLSIEKNSLAEKYAPQIKCLDFLVSVDQVIVNYDILCEDLQKIIDKDSRVNLVFSTEIPYKLDVKDYDSPILLRKNDLSQSERSSEENLSTKSNTNPLNKFNSDILLEYSIHIDDEPINTQSNNIEEEILTQEIIVEDPLNRDEIIEITNENICDNENQTVENVTNTLPEMEIDIPKIEESVNDVISNDNIDSVECSTDLSTVYETSDEVKQINSEIESNDISDLGININYVIVNKIPNVELGFQLYGGLEGGPNGETLPVFVIAVEKNTCNWPADLEEPFLKNGLHLIELNGCELSALKLSKIETMIKETENELKFKVVTFK